MSELRQPAGRASWRDRLLPWLYVIAGQSAFQLLVVVSGGLLLFLVPQAEEVLFAVSKAALQSGTAPGQSLTLTLLPFFSMIVAGLGLAFMVWYSARLMVTVDAEICLPRVLDGRDPRLETAATLVPRALGMLCSALLVGAFLFATSTSTWSRPLLIVLAVAAPLAPAVGAYVASLVAATARTRWIVWGAASAVGLVLLYALRPGDAIVASVSVFVPALFTVFVIRRRELLMRLRRRRHGLAAAAIPRAGTSVDFNSVLFGLVTVTAISLLWLAFISSFPADWIHAVGSAAVLLLFLTALVGLLSAIYLGLRHWTKGTRGAVRAVTILFLLLCIGLETWQLSPITESFGREELTPVQHAAFKAAANCVDPVGKPAKKVVVNTYGGGIRAAVFTAALLADMDDLTQGRFGNCIEGISGVSGGSVGVGIYLVLRERWVAAGYWGACSPAAPKQGLGGMVRAVLVRDHLSPVIGRMLFRDLFPFGSPARGQALLDSWNEALKSQLGVLDATPSTCRGAKSEAAGLAMPLRELTGGLDPAPKVYINSTNALDGARVWFSNDDSWRTQRELAATAVFRRLPLTVGEALLHGARFPVVSPTGLFPPHEDQTLLLVDGGYADNSGASTLFEQISQPADRLWINIDGNPIEPLPNQVGRKEAHKGFSPLRGLLAVRTSQATNAIDRVIADNPKFCPLSVALERSDTTVDACAPLRREPDRAGKHDVGREKNRRAPLGWFITQRTAEDMDCALVQAVDRICARVGCAAGGETSKAFEARRAACSASATIASTSR